MFYDQLSLCAAWQFLKKWLLIEDVFTIKEGRSRGWEDNRHALYYILIMWTVSLDVAIQRCHWQLPWSIYCTHPTHDVNDVMCEGWPHLRRLHPLHFLNSGVDSFMSHNNQISESEMGPMVFHIKLKDKFNLTCKNHFSRNKYQQYYPRFDHSVNQTRKQLWFIAERKKQQPFNTN